MRKTEEPAPTNQGKGRVLLWGVELIDIPRTRADDLKFEDSKFDLNK